MSIKSRLAHVRETSWRYKIVTGIWARDSYLDKPFKPNRTKACSFYWFYLPTSLLAWALWGIAMTVFFIAMIPITIFMWCIGYKPNFIEPSNSPERSGDTEWHPIKTVKEGDFFYKDSKAFPWGWFVFPIIGASLLYFFPKFSIIFLLIVLGMATVIGIFAGIGYLVTRRSFKEQWNRICPKLEVTEH
jgi:hypothetical protein